MSGARTCTAVLADQVIGTDGWDGLAGYNPRCYEFGVDYYGFDIPGYQFAARTPHQCQAACFLHPDCNAWTLSMDFGSTSLCFLKTINPQTPRTYRKEVISGVKDNCSMFK
jgi:hypothetical protein